MIIYNSTFIMPHDRAEFFMKWIHSKVDAGLCRGDYDAFGLRLSRVIAVEGADDFEDQALSVSFQVCFPTQAQSKRWVEDKFDCAIAELVDAMDSEVHIFSTLLEGEDLQL